MSISFRKMIEKTVGKTAFLSWTAAYRVDVLGEKEDLRKIPSIVGGDLDQCMISHEANKGYGNSLTAPADIVTEEYAKHLLLSLSETVGARLRADNVMVSLVSVHLTTCEFNRMGKQLQLDSPTNITRENAARQYSIFDLEKSDKLEKLDRAVTLPFLPVKRRGV